jgi:hypothetical protein
MARCRAPSDTGPLVGSLVVYLLDKAPVQYSKVARDSSVSYSGREGTSSWFDLQSLDEVEY